MACIRSITLRKVLNADPMDHNWSSFIEDVELGKVGLVRFCLVFRRNGFLWNFMLELCWYVKYFCGVLKTARSYPKRAMVCSFFRITAV